MTTEFNPDAVCDSFQWMDDPDGGTPPDKEVRSGRGSGATVRYVPGWPREICTHCWREHSDPKHEAHLSAGFKAARREDQMQRGYCPDCKTKVDSYMKPRPVPVARDHIGGEAFGDGYKLVFRCQKCGWER